MQTKAPYSVMSELVSNYVNYAEKRGEHIERMVEIYDNADTVRGHDLVEATEATNVKKNLQSGHTAGGVKWSRCYRLTAVCVLLLYVLLLIVVIVLWVKYSNMNSEKDQLQASYNTLNIEKNQLQTSHNMEINQLKFQRDQLLLHRDQLQQETSGLQNVILKLGWRVFSSNVYNISTEKKSWTESRKDCKNRGADLVIINSKEEQEFISENYARADAWIGLTDQKNNGEFIWLDGTSLTTKFWWNGEPNDYGGNEDCVITGYKGATSNMSTWADFSCNRLSFGICEMKIFN